MFPEIQKKILSLQTQLAEQRKLLEASFIEAFEIDSAEFPVQKLYWNYFYFDKPSKSSFKDIQKIFLVDGNINVYRHMKFNGVVTGAELNDFYQRAVFIEDQFFGAFVSPDEDSNHAPLPLPLENVSWLMLFPV